MKTPEASPARVWMNVTTSVNWNRPAVGIVRVERELFKALSTILGDRLRPCVLADGKLVPYSGPIGPDGQAAPSEADAFVWPDPSYEFPQSVTLDPVSVDRTVSRHAPIRIARTKPEDGIGFGDVLISVGLDWDWESQRLDAILYDLKTKKDVKVITCCYDLIPVLFPQYCVGDVAAKFKEYFTNLTWSSSAMLCISQQSEADYRALSAELGMPWIPTKVMPLGNKLPEGGDDVSAQINSICEDRFALFVSTIERRKNHEVLYKAVHILAERGELDPKFKLVFVGMPGWGVSDLLKDIELDPLTKDHIVQFHHTNDAELRRLYESCEFFVYPSFYEGWGLPVAEALALGKFVIASDRGSIPEVGGDLVEYVDPWNSSAWAAALFKYWNDTELVRARASRIQQEYHPAHWDETASAVMDLVDAVSGDRMKKIILYPGYDMHSLAGIPYSGRIVCVGTKGILCHGPYRPLPKGRIQIDVELEMLENEPVNLQFKFCAKDGAEVFSTKERRIAAFGKPNVSSFKLDLRKDVEDFEVVITCLDEVAISINKITMKFG